MGVDVIGSTPGRAVTKANTAGQAVLGGPTPNVGGYGQVVASLSVDSVVTHVAVAASAGSVSAPPLISVTVAIGAGGSEAVIGVTYFPAIFDPNLNGWTGASALPVPMRVAAGQRVAAKLSVVAGSTTTTAATIYVFAVPYASLEGL